MAVRLADYYRNHVRRIAALTVICELIVTGGIAVMLYETGHFSLILIVMLLSILLMEIVASIIILTYALSPLRILSTVITHVSSQANDVQPPNLNGTRHEKTGLKTMVDTVYTLAVNGNIPTTGEVAAETTLSPTTLLEELPCGIVVLNEKMAIAYANAAAPVHVDDKGNHSLQLLFDADSSLESWLTNAQLHNISDSHVWARVQNVLPDEADRKLYDVFATYHNTGNVSETILLTLDRTAHYAKDEDDMDFIALAAHELRGPITVIRGYLDVLVEELGPQLTPDQKLLIERLSVSSSRLSGYVSNILNVSRFDRRHLKLHLREDKLCDIYNTVADDLALRASTQNRILNVKIPTDLPTVAADRNSLSEVIANLIDNAIKYSAEGGQVMVSAGVDGDFVKFSVVDHGIGIPTAVIGHLFTKFYRSHRSRQTVAGTGLGLYIAKGIIESHGGRMGLRSTEGQGSTFSFSIPIYSTVAEKLLANNSENEGIIESSSGWIKNHSMYQG